MSEKNVKLTPAMKQFHHFKEKYPDAVLFFRMGDFYETFYDDAKVCSRVLGLTLTSRSKGDNPIPLAGVPFHAVDGLDCEVLCVSSAGKPKPEWKCDKWCGCISRYVF